MLHAASRLLILIAAVQILGGHWAVLQSAAWMGMLVRYAQTDTLAVAAEKTFDGEHPCSLCHAVADGRKSEQQQEIPKLLTKFQAIVVQKAPALPPPGECDFAYPSVSFSFGLRGEAPPLPPPRAA